MNHEDRDFERTALMHASYSDHGNEYDRTNVVKLLLEAGADVYKEDDDSRCALMYASEYGHTDIVRLLLEAGAKVYTEEAGYVDKEQLNDALMNVDYRGLLKI